MNKKSTPKYRFIDTKSEFKSIIKAFEKENKIAFDLEADSMFHFKEKVCLLQIATKNINIVLDTLKIKDLSPLKFLFSNPDIIKVFHGADYDVRSLYRDFGIEINNLFDTEIACRFLGIRETGLERVLNQRFNVSLNKKYQKKDWSQRPLPKEMLDYAAQDTRYLLSLAQILKKELKTKNRLDWVLEECELLSKVRPVLSNEDPLFLKFRGAGLLDPGSLAVLESLLQFRIKAAKKKDRPLFKIIGNAALMNLAKAKPVSLHRLKSLNALSPKQIGIYGPTLIDTIKQAFEIPQNELPNYPRKKAPRLKLDASKRITALKDWRDATAEALEIDPALVFTKSLLTAIAVNNPLDIRSIEKIKNLKTWQKKTFGKDIVAVLKSLN